MMKALLDLLHVNILQQIIAKRLHQMDQYLKVNLFILQIIV